MSSAGPEAAERLSHRLIGQRVKAAREAAGWTQEKVATLLGLNDRQSVSDLENGKRRLQPDELVLLSDALGREVDYFLNPFAVAGEARFSWRASPGVPQDALDSFETRVGEWIGLLRWLREGERGRVSPLKFSLRLTVHSSFEDATARAEDLVTTLDLGRVPSERLIEKIEDKLDIPVLFVDTVEIPGQSISGAACHLQELGVILVNRQEPEARRSFDVAHELFHILTWDAISPERREPDSTASNGLARRRAEHLADNFASALLMPTSSLQQMVDKRRLNDVVHLADVAAELRVAPVALAWRLLHMRWIDGATRENLARERQRSSSGFVPKRLSPSYVEMLHGAIDRGRLSARKAARAMGMSLPQLAELFAEHSLCAPFEL